MAYYPRFTSYLFHMKKLLIPIAVALSVGILPSLFADTNGTGSTSGTGSTETGSTNTGSESTGSTSTGSSNTGSTNTGSTNTGSTSTGSTSTGSTNTGSTNTGSTSTGSTSTGSTNTGSTSTGVVCGSGNLMTNLAAREAYIADLARLLAEKRVAYQAAMTLTGSAKKDAIKAANEKYRAGYKVAVKNFTLARKPILLCKKIEDKRNHHENEDRDRRSNDDNDKNKGNMKKFVKEVKKIEKKMEKNDDNRGRGRGRD